MTAQTFTTVHSFTGGSEGNTPYAGLILSGNTLYGTTANGGSSDKGTVFKVNINGSGFTTLHSFTAFPPFPSTNKDGCNPRGGLILSGDTLYGTAEKGGSSDNGIVFAVNTNGTAFTNLHDFPALSGSPAANSEGAHPYAELILSGSALYGTTYGGGIWGRGVVFKINANGTGFTNLHSFATTYPYTNSEGTLPYASLIVSGDTLYGTANSGGNFVKGTVFKVNTDGTGFANLHSFTGSDGAYSFAGLVLSGNTLYGSTLTGGDSDSGTVFSIKTDGANFTNLYDFFGGAGPYAARLVVSGNTLYGTTSFGNGTVFALNTDGVGFTILHIFAGSDGAQPLAGLILSGNTLYGTTSAGGSSGGGTIFSLTLPPPQLTIIRSGTNVIVTWPTNDARLTLHSNTNLVSPAIWIAVSPGPVVVNGQNAVTNPVSGTKKFYRLSQ